MSRVPEPDDVLTDDERSRLGAARASTDALQAVLRVIADIAREKMAVSTFSATTCRPEALELERIFSSRPDAYPVGARKSKVGTSWAQHVMRDRKVFVGEGALEMAAAFDDQQRMASLGIRSIINVPILVGDRCIAVLNFGRDVERIEPADVHLARCLGEIATAAFEHDVHR